MEWSIYLQTSGLGYRELSLILAPAVVNLQLVPRRRVLRPQGPPVYARN